MEECLYYLLCSVVNIVRRLSRGFVSPSPSISHHSGIPPAKAGYRRAGWECGNIRWKPRPHWRKREKRRSWVLGRVALGEQCRRGSCTLGARPSRNKGVWLMVLVFLTPGAGVPPYIGPNSRACRRRWVPTFAGGCRSRGSIRMGPSGPRMGPLGAGLGVSRGWMALGRLRSSLTTVHCDGCIMVSLEDFSPSMERGG